MKYRRIVVNRERQLELVEDDLPNPRPGEVRLKILAAGVSYPDVMMGGVLLVLRACRFRGKTQVLVNGRSPGFSRGFSSAQ